MNRLRVGDSAPDFALSSESGQLVKLSDFRGRKSVVLYFYPKDFMRDSQLEARTFASRYESFRELGAEILGVSSGSIESHRSFSTEFGLPFPLLSDGDNRVHKLYRVAATFGPRTGRVTYIVDKDGVVRHMYASHRDAEHHTNEALRVLRAVAGEPSRKSRRSNSGDES